MPDEQRPIATRRLPTWEERECVTRGTRLARRCRSSLRSRWRLPPWAEDGGGDRRAAGPAVQGPDHHHRLGGGPASARSAEFLRPEVEGAHRHRRQGVEVSTAEMFTKIMQEYRAGTGAYDALNVIPAWMPDLANAGALEPLDAYVDKYGFRDELQKIAPTYRDNQMMVDGKIFGFPDDGDVFLFYYRKDIFADPEIQEEFKAKTGMDLAVPKTWAEFDEIGAVPDRHAEGQGHLWRRLLPPAALHHVHVPGALPQRGRQVLRCRHHEGDDQLRHRRQGADRDARGEQVHAAGRRAVGLRREPRGLPAGPDGDDDLLAALWPLGRGLRHGPGGAELGAEVDDRRQGRLRAAAGRASAARGGLRAVGRLDVKNKDAAYLFIQWLNSEDISLQRVQLPDALRDPFRDRHFTSPEYLAKWPDAKDYLAALRRGRQDRPARPVAAADRQV